MQQLFTTHTFTRPEINLPGAVPGRHLTYDTLESMGVNKLTCILFEYITMHVNDHFQTSLTNETAVATGALSSYQMKHKIVHHCCSNVSSEKPFVDLQRTSAIP